ncbi:SusC/RagA family TonB-linked outer membrane protein [Xylanibacter ruminicola]|uniref:TonB-linked outer membrane protein, SusC/RagA family n=1 Tax=Xylanibacter ruminicola TaxID=839 RepID=A0A1M6STK4_XYLRU|nr:TonB-dependent receptor [Xylanibacter ruminicola]SHK48019.1 TonB-linked outer membrane protein, SusC/RagA family [Xylanibacter ruminicola]
MWNFKSLQKPLMALFLLCLFPMGALAQSLVKGTVNDEAGEPVIGATVKVQGTNIGAITDFNGNFQIQAASNATLNISYVGYVPQSIKVAGKTNITVVLKEDAQMLNDVVVVGYGTMKKSDISGSVATVDQEAVMKRVPTNVAQALQGAAAGVMVSQQDGSPDGKAAIRIRGIGTINGDASPLYVVDGVQVGTSADFINPADIERIEVLKDASATAIYGSAGANGVIMITTKHGQKGRTNITITADFGLQTLPYTLDVMNLNTYATAIKEAKANDNGMFINKLWTLSDFSKVKEINWQKEMTRAALKQQYGASLNGGNEKTQYNLSFGYNKIDGLVINTNYQRFTARANVNTKVNKYLEVGGDINYTHSESYGSNMSLGNNQNMSSLRDFASMTPTLDYFLDNDPNKQLVNVNLVNPDGTYGTGTQQSTNGWEGNTTIGANPYASQMENGDRARNGFDRIQTTAFIDLTFLDLKHHKLDLRSQGTYTYWGNNSSDYTGGRHRYNRINGEWTEIPMQSDQSYAFSLNNSHGYSLGLQTYLTYNLTYDIHNLTLMVGNEVGKSWGQWVSASARNFPSVLNRAISLTEKPDDIQGNGAYNGDSRSISYFARASYSLMDRYILTATIRKDGSSNFGSGNRWGTFPSVAGAWRISEEPFMKDIKFVNNLKLRFGWGQTGNAGNMAGKAVYALSADAAYNFYGTNGISGAFGGNRDRQTGWFAPLVDTNLKWETNEMLNFGIDFAFLNDWDITLDYFVKTTKDLLLYQQFRPTAGNTQVYTNYGEIQNKGFEFAIGYHKQINKDFGINARLTGSTIKNKVKKMGDPLYNTASGNSGAGAYDGSQVGAVDGNGHWNNHSICMEGEAVGSFYGYVFDGIIKDEADLKEYLAYYTDATGKFQDAETKIDASQGHPLAVGDAKFKDLNGDHVIDQNDRTILGNGFPALNYGITVGANYKDWDFSLYMYGVFGQDILSYSAMKLSSMTQLDDQTTPNILTEAYNQAFRNGSGSLPRLSIGDYARNTRVSSLWVKNGDFLRIGNLQVGYTLPKNISNMLSIQKARVYLGVNNLLTISGYNKYGDPECGSGSVLYQGLDTGRYPQPRTFMGGINVTF